MSTLAVLAVIPIDRFKEIPKMGSLTITWNAYHMRHLSVHI